MDLTRKVPNKNIANLNRALGVFGGFLGFEEFVNAYGMKKPAIRINWDEISSMTYPMPPVDLGWGHIKAPVGNGIELKMVNGKKLYLIVYGKKTETETAKDLYELINRLHQEYTTGQVNQLGSSASGLEHYTDSQPTAPVHMQAAQAAPAAGTGITCPSCGNVQEAGDKFCIICGQKLGAEQRRGKFCSQCGAPINEGMLFCMECGSKI
ncbi:MAG: zinc ribbon domain-containing protein [Lachnospiraceae bacterium]|nr:zinc ribbon domain-containing protein [Lachnospiraceae bacterium]